MAYFHHRIAQRRVDAAIDSFKPDHVLCQLVRTTEYVRHRYPLPKTLDYMDTLEQGHRAPHRDRALLPAAHAGGRRRGG